jgi:tRNA pseudouridine38-40 synthase
MGTLLEVGVGSRSADSIAQIIDAKDREKAGALVPGKGLVLEKVFY